MVNIPNSITRIPSLAKVPSAITDIPSITDIPAKKTSGGNTTDVIGTGASVSDVIAIDDANDKVVVGA